MSKSMIVITIFVLREIEWRYRYALTLIAFIWKVRASKLVQCTGYSEMYLVLSFSGAYPRKHQFTDLNETLEVPIIDTPVLEGLLLTSCHQQYELPTPLRTVEVGQH
jgi:hypothetical protein